MSIDGSKPTGISVFSTITRANISSQGNGRVPPQMDCRHFAFFEGNISATIELKDHPIPVAGSDHSISYCNVYALKQTEECFSRLCFPSFRFKRFDIDIDLPKGSHGGLGTYTELLADGRRLHISGPIMLSWYFILAMAA